MQSRRRRARSYRLEASLLVALAAAIAAAAARTADPAPLASVAAGACADSAVFALAVHGGASNGAEALRGALRERVFESGPAFLGSVLERGRELLRRGATGLDTVEAVVRALEDSGLFNAGRGSVRNAEGVVECEAALMDGRSSRAGGVAAVRVLRNPIAAARLVMERSPHVLLVGPEAEQLAISWGAESVDPAYFAGPARGAGDGTVGAVALDRCGNLAAATSSGGRAGKLPGRVSDTPIPGAGTWARNGSVAVSATGHGEHLMRAAAAHEIAALVVHGGLDVEAAARRVVRELREAGGAAGVIAIDARGRVAVAFNTELMLRGFATAERAPRVGVR
jgi:beta-aspartyl-peptidase (threonine type)